jgi:hypothetical protein
MFFCCASEDKGTDVIFDPHRESADVVRAPASSQQAKPVEKVQVLSAPAIEKAAEKVEGDVSLFEVEVKKYSGEVGLKCDVTDEDVLLVKEVLPGGDLSRWNRDCSPEKAVKEYDRILKINGQTGKSIELVGLFKADKIILTIQRPQVLEATVERTGELGINLHYKKTSFGLVIRDIFSTGDVAKWNEKNPHSKVRPGDRISAVNGLTAPAPDLVKMMRDNPTAPLKLTIRQYDKA